MGRTEVAGQAPAAPRLRVRTGGSFGVPLGIQHVVFLGSILILALTGLPQRLDTLGPSVWIIDRAGGIETLRSVHHAAGAALVSVALYHVATVIVAVSAGRMADPLAMIPGPRDARDALAAVRYLAGANDRQPALPRPSYFEKADYWVIAWGAGAMGLSGLARLFPERATGTFGGDVVAAALELHSDLAILFVAWVGVVHVAHAALSGQRPGEVKLDSAGGPGNG